MSSFLEYFRIREIHVSDILDILIIWFVIYNLFRVIRGSRTMQMAFGLFALFAGQILAEQFGLVVVSKSIGSLFNIIPVAIIVLFQDEIRKILASIGSNRFLGRAGWRPENRDPALEPIFKAALQLSKNNLGALIVFEGEQGLRNYEESGTKLDAMPSVELLVDLFQPKSNLHDGAVLVSGSRLASAACFMPLSRNPSLPKKFGTRHRAAIGISEETDSISLVVSEETGQISFAHDGDIHVVGEKTLKGLTETFNLLRLGESPEAKKIVEKKTRKSRRSSKKTASKSKSANSPENQEVV